MLTGFKPVIPDTSFCTVDPMNEDLIKETSNTTQPAGNSGEGMLSKNPGPSLHNDWFSSLNLLAISSAI